MISRKTFFDTIRRTVFGGRLSAQQVDGLTRILDCYETRYEDRIGIPGLAYILATAKHETGHTMQPVRERGGRAYHTRMYDIRGERPEKARELGNVYPGDGAKFPGLGLAQWTGRSNARKATRIVLDVSGEVVDFQKQPDLLMDWRWAALLLFEGFLRGAWTGRKLDDYIGGGRQDFVGARRIVNGRDRARDIAAIAVMFLYALKAAEQAGRAAPAQAPPEPKPENPSADPSADPGAWQDLTGAPDFDGFEQDPQEDWRENPDADIPDADMEPAAGDYRDVTTGKRWWRSSTIWSQFGHIGTAMSSAGAVVAGVDWKLVAVLGVTAVTLFAVWTIRERWLKSFREGV